jgi:hypothetical protein
MFRLRNEVMTRTGDCTLAGNKKRRGRYLPVLLCAIAVAIIAGYFVLRVVRYPLIQITAESQSQSSRGYSLFAPTVDDLGYELQEPAEIYLLDMNGNVVHTWYVLGSVQLARLKPDGNLLYSTRDRSFRQRAGVREVDPFGNVLWFYKCWVDHDFCLLENGNLLIHYIEDKEAPEIGPGKIRCPGIIEVTPDRDVVWEWRAEEHLEELTGLVGIEFPLDKEGKRLFDWAHSNTCQVIGENRTSQKDPRFRPGNILFSYCNLNTIGVIDKATGQIVWAWGPGVLDGQHNPQMLENGNLLVFDNGTDRGYSRIIELDPVSESIVWEYSDKDSAAHKFYSAYLSGAQPLPNGNVFVCQGSFSRQGLTSRFYRFFFKSLLGRQTISSRLFEVNRDGQVVWDCTLTANGKSMHGVYQAARYSSSYLRPLLESLERLERDETRKLKSVPYLR